MSTSGSITERLLIVAAGIPMLVGVAIGVCLLLIGAFLTVCFRRLTGWKEKQL